MVKKDAGSVVFDSSYGGNGDDKRHLVHRGYAGDRLDTRYRYWSFMEAHPAHISLPQDAHQDAMDALNWASTSASYDLLSPHHKILAPFTWEECQRLTALLQSIAPASSLRTRMVSRILLRVICSRQSHPCLDKPLPADAQGRPGPNQEDHSTPVRSSAFMLMIAIYACLATAISLCPIQNLVRLAGVVVILIFLFPAVSNVVEIVQSKADDGSIMRRTPNDHTVTGSGPSTPPSWLWSWQGLESLLHKAPLSEPSGAVPTTNS
ncbi:hypothetical protein BD779DRAFT_1673540 [Infundibulicybe gibba]|nr:hypothetical protein BD779DRAFT_1673540 [Infundibulicybe gibba]